MSAGVDPVVERRAVLEAELAALEAELAEYQQLTDEIPAIYEEKFRQQVQQLALELRRLMDERDGLHRQIAALQPALEAPWPLLAASAAPPVSARARSAWAVSWCRLPRLWRWSWPQRRPRQRWLWAGAALIAGSALVVVVLRPLVPSAPAPASPAPTSLPARPAALLLRADGECWLEVQTLAGQILYANTLQAGQSLRLPLPGPVRLRAGRPDLLQISLDGQPFAPLGAVTDVGWHPLNPPAPTEALPAKAS